MTLHQFRIGDDRGPTPSIALLRDRRTSQRRVRARLEAMEGNRVYPSASQSNKRVANSIEGAFGP